MDTSSQGQEAREGEDAGPLISVVIPTLNEEEGIEECISCAKQAFDELGVSGEIIISDSSADRTPEIASELGARVVEPNKPGYGNAYLYAFQHIRGDIIAIGDGDTTYDFTELPRLVEEINDGGDFVIGSRYDGRIERGAMPWVHKYIGNPLLTAFLNVFYRMDISDAHSGFRVFTRDALGAIEPETSGMEFASEMLVRAKEADLDVREVPITYNRREGEATLESFADGWRHLRFIIVNAPGEVFTTPGLLFTVGGLVVMIVTLLNVPPLGILDTNSVIAGSLLTLLRSNVVALGEFSTRARNPIRSPRRLLPVDLTELLSIERGIATGAGLFVAGLTYATILVYRWITSGLDVVPDPSAGVVAMTAIALGLQIVFQMFFISLLEDVEE